MTNKPIRVNPFEMTCARYIEGACVLIGIRCLECHARYIAKTAEIAQIVRRSHKCKNGKRDQEYRKVAAA